MSHVQESEWTQDQDQDKDESFAIEPKGRLIQRYNHEKGNQLGTVYVETIEDPDDRQRFYDLCEACRGGDIEQVDKLVSYGVNVSYRNNWSWVRWQV